MEIAIITDSTISTAAISVTPHENTDNFYECAICLKEELLKFQKLDVVNSLEEHSNNYEAHLCRLFGIDLPRVFTVLHSKRPTFCKDCGARIEKIVELFNQIDALQANVNHLKRILEADFRNSCDPDNNCFKRDKSAEDPGNEFWRNEIAKSLDIFQGDRVALPIKENEKFEDQNPDDDFFDMPVEVEYYASEISEIEPPASISLTHSNRSPAKSQNSSKFTTIITHQTFETLRNIPEENNIDTAISNTAISNTAISKKFNLKEFQVRIQTLSSEILNNVPINVYKVPGYTKASSRTIKRKKRNKIKMIPNFRCDYPNCTSFRISEELLEIHKKQVHLGMKNVYECNHCDKTFSTNSSLQMHIDIKHIGKFTYSCQVCGMGFQRKYLFERHLPVHSVEKQHKCPECPSAFKHKNGLMAHKRFSHLGERRFWCDRCGKSFYNKTKLNNHVKVMHEKGDLPVICHVCGKGFPIEGYLYMHMKTHAKHEKLALEDPSFFEKMINRRAKPRILKYSCDQCPMKFCHRDQLENHVRVKHLGQFSYVCPICNKGYKSLPWNIKRHLKLHGWEKDAIDKYVNDNISKIQKNSENLIEKNLESSIEKNSERPANNLEILQHPALNVQDKSLEKSNNRLM